MNRLLLNEQAVFDRLEFDPANGYVPLTTREQKAEHILLHSVNAAAKLAVGAHVIVVREVIPDLAIYRSQLINTFRLKTADLVKMIPAKPSIEGGTSGLFIGTQKDRLAIANGKLAKFIEPKKHGEQSARQALQEAVRGLHSVAINLAEAYEIDLETAHLLRLEGHLGGPLPNS